MQIGGWGLAAFVGVIIAGSIAVKGTFTRTGWIAQKDNPGGFWFIMCGYGVIAFFFVLLGLGMPMPD